MFILDNISGICSDPGLANILAIIKRFMNIIWIIGPILAIVSAVIIAIKMMSNPDEKKYKPLFKNCITALLMLFLVPLLVNVVMGLFDDTFEIAACWNQASNVSTNGQNSGYIDNDKDKSGSMLTDPSKYETGTPPTSSSGSSIVPASSSTYTSTKNKIKYNLYNQADSRWGSTKFSSGSTIAASGCMITSTAVISSAYNSSITPLTVFNSAHRHNHPRNGINALSSGYFSCSSGSTSSSSITSALNNGQVIVIKVYGKNKNGSSPFTSSQHYMALIDINGSKIFVGNAYSSGGHGVAGWFSSSEVLTSVQSADYCTPSDALKAMHR